MACNAHNHSWNCNCGWGGDTGYGWQNQGQSIHPKLGEPARPSIRISTTIPNARCPVCGEVVFFYSSPFGGRVFFDELGPPWPKHPCTDNPRRSVTLRSPIEIKRAPTPEWRWKRDDWILLRNINLRQADGETFLSGQGTECSTTFNFGWQGEARFTPDDPVYCRRSPSGTGEFELSYLPVNARLSTGAPETILVIRNATASATLRKWQAANEGDAEAQNEVGMSLSYSRFNERLRSLGMPNDIDWAAAEHWFRVSSAQDHWAGHHNLGVMHLRGDGVDKSDDLAFHHLSLAAESGEAASLYRLADLFEHGIGAGTDTDEAARLRALANNVT